MEKCSQMPEMTSRTFILVTDLMAALDADRELAEAQAATEAEEVDDRRQEDRDGWE